MRPRPGALALAALAPLATLAVDPGGWYPFGPVKWMAVSALVLGGAAVSVRGRSIHLPNRFAVAIACFLGLLAIAAFQGADPTYAWLGTPERHFGFLTWLLCAIALVVGRSLTRDDSRAVVVGVLIAAIGVGAVATAEALGWEPDVLDVGRRLTGTLGSSAYLGAATALLLPISIGVAFDRAGSLLRRRLAGVAVPLLVAACLGSGARAAWFGLAVAAVATAWFRRPWIAERLRRHRERALGGGLLAVVAVVLLVALTPVGSRLSSMGDRDAPGGGQGRVDEWRVAARVVRKHPLLGVGPEGYRVEVRSGIDPEYERAHGRDPLPDRAHALPLDLALAGGVGALAGWVAVWALVARSVRRVLRTGRPWLVGVGAGLVAHVFGQLFLFPVMELEPLAWLLAGIVVLHAPVGKRSKVRPAGRVLVGGLAIGAVLAVGAGVTDIVADHRARAATDALARGDADAAADEALSAIDLRPDIVRLRVLAAVALVEDEQGTLAAIEQLDDALDVSPGDPIALLRRVRLLADRAAATGVQRHLVEAVNEVERLLARDPYNAALWRVAEDLAAQAGDRDAEVRAGDIADDLDPPDRDR